MTIKYQKKNISAETKPVITDISLNNQTKILTVTKENLNNDPSSSNTISIDLSGLSREFIRLRNEEELEAKKNSNDPDIIKERENSIYLVPASQNDEESFHKEYIWIEDINDFELFGSVDINIDPLISEIETLKTILNVIETQNNEETIYSSARLDGVESDISALEQNKLNKHQTNQNGIVTTNQNGDITIVEGISKNSITDFDHNHSEYVSNDILADTLELIKTAMDGRI